MERMLEEIAVFFVYVVYFLILALIGYVIYTIQCRLDKKRDKKRGRVSDLVKKKEGELT